MESQDLKFSNVGSRQAKPLYSGMLSLTEELFCILSGQRWAEWPNSNMQNVPIVVDITQIMRCLFISLAFWCWVLAYEMWTEVMALKNISQNPPAFLSMMTLEATCSTYEDGVDRLTHIRFYARNESVYLGVYLL